MVYWCSPTGPSLSESKVVAPFGLHALEESFFKSYFFGPLPDLTSSKSCCVSCHGLGGRLRHDVQRVAVRHEPDCYQAIPKMALLLGAAACHTLFAELNPLIGLCNVILS